MHPHHDFHLCKYSNCIEHAAMMEFVMVKPIPQYSPVLKSSIDCLVPRHDLVHFGPFVLWYCQLCNDRSVSVCISAIGQIILARLQLAM